MLLEQDLGIQNKNQKDHQQKNRCLQFQLFYQKVLMNKKIINKYWRILWLKK